MSFVYDFFWACCSRFFQYFSYQTAVRDGKLRVYFKTDTGYTLSELEPKWSIKNVKTNLAPRLGFEPEELKIIFAGKELSDETIIDECDLGQRSVLHAVRRRPQMAQMKNVNLEMVESLQAPSKPLCATLGDLQLQSAIGDELNDEDKTKNKAHFYVYCAQCKKLCRGKLRVRCALCKNGAFTVHEDPKCWHDVLKPSRISGKCENCAPACDDGEIRDKLYAEFYFKCAEHISCGENDFAAPLDLIKINIGNVPCVACTVVEQLVALFPCAFKHVTCLDCFVQYCRSRLSERRFVWHPTIGYTLPCPIGCKDSFIEVSHHFKLLPTAEYERYLQFAAEEFVLQSGGFLCPQPGCGMGLLVDQDCQHDGECICCENCRKEFRLSDCSTIDASSFCGIGGGYWNEVDRKFATDVERDGASNLTIHVSTKPCPKCRTPTEHAGGCMHMTCTRSGCGFDWCWICQSEWTRYCQCNHWFLNF